MKTVHYNGKELVITYRNDVIFKRMLASNDDISKEILSFVIEAITGKKYRNVTVTNVESIGRHVLEKRHILDIRAEDEEGNIFNIEMQQSALLETDMKRFQGYIYRILSGELDAGEEYEKMRPAVQIVFTTKRFGNKLITEYKQRQVDGTEMVHNLASFYFVSLPVIEEIYRRKKKEGKRLNNAEMFSYILHRDDNRAIIDMTDDEQKRVMKLMEKKFEESVQDRNTLDEAVEVAYYDRYIESKLQDYKKEGIQEGIELGLERGRQQGRQEGLEQSLQIVLKKQYNKEAYWLDSCTSEQLSLVLELALQNVEYDEIKRLLEI